MTLPKFTTCKTKSLVSALSCTLCIMIMGVAGCVADDANERPPVGPPPTNPVPTRMFMAAQPTVDTNSNGYLDSFVATVYLFQNSYQRSVRVKGTFTIEMVAKNNKQIRVWNLSEPNPNIAAISSGVGPGYVMRISLLSDNGTDVLSGQTAEVKVSFKDEHGNVIQAQSTAALIGKIIP